MYWKKNSRNIETTKVPTSKTIRRINLRTFIFWLFASKSAKVCCRVIIIILIIAIDAGITKDKKTAETIIVNHIIYGANTISAF